MSLWKRKTQPETPELDFGALIRSCGEKAFNFAYRLSGNEADSRDLVQEAFVNAYEKQDDYDRSRPFDSWLLRILHNIYIDGVRKESVRKVHSLDAPVPDTDGSWDEILPGPDPEPGIDLVRRQNESLVHEALDALPIHYRTAVVLCDLEGFPYEEIAKIMACPVGTVRSRIHQGRDMIRRYWMKMEKMDTRKISQRWGQP
jgi:RNA polymerase sigma-70 factor (ECF subfamily)